MKSHGRRLDHWRTSLDTVEALRARLAEVGVDHEDAVARRLMAQVALAKSSSFIALLDGEGNVLDVNPAALIAGGVDRSEVVGLSLEATAWWAGAGEEGHRALARALAAAAEGRFVRFDVAVRIESGGRATGTLDLSLRPLRARDGRVAFIVAEGRSITDRKRTEQRIARQHAELSALTERLARVHDYRERLLGELSHDLRAPLQVVVARAEQLMRAHAAGGVERAAAGIRLAALDAIEQVNDMLEQVRADHGEARLALVDADLAQAIRTAAGQFEALAEAHRIELRVEARGPVKARFDVERVSRIVSNLLANAIRHASEQGVVRCSLREDGTTAQLEVADSGPGVAPEYRAQVFGRYRSGLNGDGRSRGAGAGLGLAIVREFVELHGGAVSLTQAPEGGALFAVTLPLRPAAGEALPATLSQHAAAAQRTEYVLARLEAELAPAPEPRTVPTILIVERVHERAEQIADGFGEDAVTCVAGDAFEALRVALELRPDAVVVGSAIGDPPSTTLLRRLVQEDRLSGMRRIALAGEREEDPSEELLYAAGAELVLPAAESGALGDRLLGSAIPR